MECYLLFRPVRPLVYLTNTDLAQPAQKRYGLRQVSYVRGPGAVASEGESGSDSGFPESAGHPVAAVPILFPGIRSTRDSIQRVRIEQSKSGCAINGWSVGLSAPPRVSRAAGLTRLPLVCDQIGREAPGMSRFAVLHRKAGEGCIPSRHHGGTLVAIACN